MTPTLNNQDNKFTKLRIFVASPSDVAKERDSLRLIINELNQTIADQFKLILELLDWRTHVAALMGRPQQVILDQLPLEKWDVFIGILWARFGTPPGESNPETGEPYLSGTQEEFTYAYQAWQKTGRPQILFYRCMRDIKLDETDFRQAQQVQQFFEEFEITGKHPGLPQTYQDTKDFETRVRKDLTRLLFDYNRERLQATRAPELANSIARLDVGHSPSPPLSPLPFINREDELIFISSQYAPAYHLIDAPAGYGKTALLKELRQRFEEQRWLCAYISIQEHRNFPSIAWELARELGILLGSDGTPRQLGRKLGEGILGLYGEEFGQDEGNMQGVVLLIDVDKTPWSSLLPVIDSIFVGFIPGVEDLLRRFEYFKPGTHTGTHNSFRVIFAGRYLAGKTPPSTPFPLTVRKLTPFDYDVVRETVRAYLPDRLITPQFAAHLMHYTGGHPGCMAQVLKRYEEAEESSPDEFFRSAVDEIRKDIVWREIDAIRMDIDSDLRRILDDLSIFRFLDYSLLRDLLSQVPFSVYGSAFDLADKLTQTFLMDWEGRCLTDSITRRLLALRLLQEVGPEAFAWHCQRAQKICAARLKDEASQMPEKWAVEFMFQSLQEYAGKIQTEQQRETVRRKFYDQVVPTILQLLIKNRTIQEELDTLLRVLKKDLEFRFTINYYLRQNQYTDEPFDELHRRIERFLDEFTKVGGNQDA